MELGDGSSLESKWNSIGYTIMEVANLSSYLEMYSASYRTLHSRSATTESGDAALATTYNCTLKRTMYTLACRIPTHLPRARRGAARYVAKDHMEV